MFLATSDDGDWLPGFWARSLKKTTYCAAQREFYDVADVRLRHRREHSYRWVYGHGWGCLTSFDGVVYDTARSSESCTPWAGAREEAGRHSKTVMDRGGGPGLSHYASAQAT